MANNIKIRVDEVCKGAFIPDTLEKFGVYTAGNTIELGNEIFDNFADISYITIRDGHKGLEVELPVSRMQHGVMYEPRLSARLIDANGCDQVIFAFKGNKKEADQLLLRQRTGATEIARLRICNKAIVAIDSVKQSLDDSYARFKVRRNVKGARMERQVRVSRTGMSGIWHISGYDDDSREKPQKHDLESVYHENAYLDRTKAQSSSIPVIALARDRQIGDIISRIGHVPFNMFYSEPSLLCNLAMASLMVRPADEKGQSPVVYRRKGR